MGALAEALENVTDAAHRLGLLQYAALPTELRLLAALNRFRHWMHVSYARIVELSDTSVREDLIEGEINPILGVNAMPLTRNRVKRRVRLSIGKRPFCGNFYESMSAWEVRPR